jgi:hypothetical protein
MPVAAGAVDLSAESDVSLWDLEDAYTLPNVSSTNRPTVRVGLAPSPSHADLAIVVTVLARAALWDPGDAVRVSGNLGCLEMLRWAPAISAPAQRAARGA